jgi:hypothetical protein
MLTSTQTTIDVGALHGILDTTMSKIDQFCDPALTVATDVIFPESKCMYKYQVSSKNPWHRTWYGALSTTSKHGARKDHAGACIHGTPATRCFSTHVAMPGCVDTTVRNSMRDAEYVCLTLNIAPEGTRAFLLDSVANDPLMKTTDTIQEHIEDYDVHCAITGQGVQSSFTTEASGNIGITLTATSDSCHGFFFDMIVSGAQFAQSLAVDLMLVAFFTRRGCNVIFRGRDGSEDPSPAGEAEIKLYEFVGPRACQYKGSIMLQYWHNLWFFTYTMYHPIRDHIVSVAMHASNLQVSKRAPSLKLMLFLVTGQAGEYTTCLRLNMGRVTRSFFPF